MHEDPDMPSFNQYVVRKYVHGALKMQKQSVLNVACAADAVPFAQNYGVNLVCASGALSTDVQFSKISFFKNCGANR